MRSRLASPVQTLTLERRRAENRKVYRSGTTSSTMSHGGRKYTYTNEVDSLMRKLWRKGVGMLEIWKAKHAKRMRLPGRHLRSRIRQQSYGIRRILKSRFTGIASTAFLMAAASSGVVSEFHYRWS